MKKYANFKCESCIQKLKVDYLLYGREEKKITTIDLSKYSFLKKIYADLDTEIYLVEKD